MEDRLFKAIRKPINSVNNNVTAGFKKALKAIEDLPEDVPFFFEDGGEVNLDGKFKVTKNGEIAFAGGVSGTVPVSGLPVDADIDAEFAKEWDVRNSGKLEVGYYIRFQVGEKLE